MSDLMIEKYGVIHQIADCQDCQKFNHDHCRARQWGYNHAKKTGHAVIVETGTAVKYN